MSVGIITAIYGDYDEVPPIPDGFDQAVLVSDRPVKSDWQNIVYDLPIPPRLAAKFPKCRPDLFLNTQKSVWIDASLRVTSNWLTTLARETISPNEICLFAHPTRKSISEEEQYCRNLDKYKNWPMLDQISYYKNTGFEDDIGLWAGGIIIRNHTNIMQEFGDQWIIENAFRSIQDQLSLPYLIWKNRLIIKKIQFDLYRAPLEFRGHKEENIGGGYRPDMDFKSLVSEFNILQLENLTRKQNGKNSQTLNQKTIKLLNLIATKLIKKFHSKS